MKEWISLYHRLKHHIYIALFPDRVPVPEPVHIPEHTFLKAPADAFSGEFGLQDISLLLHELRTYQVRSMPRHDVQVLVSSGCSGNWYFDWISENYGEVDNHIGVEYYSPKPVGLPANVTWVENTVSDMGDLENDSADLVFSGQNIEHLWPDEVVGSLLEAYRVLRPGGWYVVDSPNRFITAQLGWSHGEHIIEFTPEEACELLELAGLTPRKTVGLWNCYDPVEKRVLPLMHSDPSGMWPVTRRILAGESDPSSSMLWWIEAEKADRKPDATALSKRVEEIFAAAWPERVQRLLTQVGVIEEDGEGRKVTCQSPGVLLYGPYFPLRKGSYQVSWFLSAPEISEDDAETELATCDVFADKKVFAEKKITGADFLSVPPGEWLRVDIPFELEELQFNFQFRVVCPTSRKITADMRVEFLEHPRL